MKQEIDQLHVQIQQLRQELILIVGETGLNSEDTLKCSQELDELIINYQIYVGRSDQKKPQNRVM